MKRTPKIRLTAVMMAAVLAITAGLPLSVSATEKTQDTVSSDTISEETGQIEPEPELPVGGLMPAEINYIDRIDDSMLFDEEAFEQSMEQEISTFGLLRDESNYGSALYENEYDKYSTNFFYNQLDETEKEVWDRMDALCLSYMTGTKNADSYQDSYMTEFISYKGMSQDEVHQLARIFRISNPQYYFLKTSVWYYPSLSELAFGIYPLFQNGVTRQSYTSNVITTADSWIAEASGYSSDSAKLKYLHDKVADSVAYNNDIISNGTPDASKEDEYFSQSAYSVFCTEKTVCAGYSQALEMVLNGAGVDCVAVTSSDHEWNKVRIDDNWYNVDCTWNDQQDKLAARIIYTYYGKSDENFSESSHTEESFWNEYLFSCVLDTGASYSSPGTFPTVSQTTAEPAVIIAKTPENETYQVTMSVGDANAKIYYTLEGGDTPSNAYYKSKLYKGSFSVEAGKTVKAIAVSSGKKDSSIKMCKWHALTFDGNSADSGDMDSIGYYEGGSVKLPSIAYAKEGYIFQGWNTASDGTGESFADGEQIDLSKVGWTSDTTLYAQWILDTREFPISYVLNGGTNDGSNPEAYVVNVGITEFYPAVRTGYIFEGWYSDLAMTKAVTTIPYGTVGDITLYAKWRGISYSVVFDGNGADLGTMEEQSVVYGGESSLRTWQATGAYRKDGFYLSEWNTASDGSGLFFSNEELCDNICDGKGIYTDGQTITLYAVWVEDDTDFSITYVLNEGVNCTDSPTSYHRSDETILLSEPVRSEYLFAGWYTDAGFTKPISQIKYGSTGDITLYAKWISTDKTYSITYVLNGGTNHAANPKSYRRYGTAVSLYTPTRSGYNFAGWYTDAGFTKPITKIVYGTTGNLTLYAKWMLPQYTIVYNLKGGVNHSANPATYDKSQTVVFKKPTKTGYTFAGWYTDSKYKNKITKIKKGSKGNIKVYAKWTANQYSIVFKANGGKGSMSKMSCTYGKSYRLTKNAFTRQGYRFVGWNTKKDGTGISYKDKKKIKNLIAKSKGKVTLYAQWKKK